MITKKLSLLISLLVCVTAALLVWVAGSSSTIPETPIKGSVVDNLNDSEDKKKPIDKTQNITSTTDKNGNTIQPESAKTLQAVIDNNGTPLDTKNDDLESKIAKLDQTITEIDKQLIKQGITPAKVDTPSTEDSSQRQRIQAIKDQLNTSQ